MKEMKIKKITAVVLAIVMIISAGAFTVSAANPEETGLLPVRAIFEESGASVEWRAEDGTIHIELMGQAVILHTNQPLAYANNEAVELQDGIILWNGRSFITQTDLEILMRAVMRRPNPEENTPVAFMSKFAAGDIMGMLQTASAELQAAAEALAEIYQMILVSRGSFIDWSVEDSQEIDGYLIVDFAVNSTMGKSGYRVTVNPDGEVAGLFDLGFAFATIPVDEDAAYAAEPVVIGEDAQWAVDGLLTVPKDASEENPVPAVVLVHGSGSHNMDSSIFDNRPFYDIADYLSSNNIAVLRYNERGWTHADALIQLGAVMPSSVSEEYEDALSAIKILQDDPRIGKIYVAGHSLGGFIAPTIAELGEADGVIILAGTPRPLHHVSYDQNLQAINDAVKAGLITQDEADMLLDTVDAMLEEANNLPNLTDEEIEGMFVFGALPADYARSFYDVLPLPVISRNIIPTLILQPGRDFQVSVENDFNLFVENTKDYAHVQTVLYDGLNHLFMTARTDFNDIREYMLPGNVDETVLADIAEWILNENISGQE